MSPNPHPKKYNRATHAPDCPCRPCRAARGEAKEAHSIKIDPALWSGLKTVADATGRKLIACLEEAVKEYLERRNV